MPKHRRIEKDREKRRSQRIFFINVRYRIGKSGSYKSAIGCQDISGHGLRVSLSDHPQPGDEINVLIDLQGEPSPISGVCRVAWVREHSDGHCLAGLEFKSLKNPESFLHYFCQKLLDFSIGDEPEGFDEKKKTTGPRS